MPQKVLTQKTIPHHSELVEYNYAVAGHDGTLCDTDGEMFIKPCTQSEIDFYQTLQTSQHSRMAEIVPLFMGSLSLNDATDINSINEQLPVVSEHISQHMKEQVIEMIHREHPQKATKTTSGVAPKSNALAAPLENVEWVPNMNRKITTNTAVALENAAFGYKRPNIMDVKLGRRLWADDAPLEKKQRFDKISAETTHRDHGFRIAGMRVYKGAEDQAELDQENYKIYDKDYGRREVNNENVLDAFRGFIYNTHAGIDEDYARAVAEAFRRDLEHVRDVLEGEETRMYSSSLLFIFEGDGDALKAAIDERSGSTVNSVKAKPDEHLPGRSTSRIDSGIGLDEDGEITLPGNGEEATSDSDEDLEDEPRIWSLKLIDFAHAQWTPGQGPDENILLGVRSLINIFTELSK